MIHRIASSSASAIAVLGVFSCLATGCSASHDTSLEAARAPTNSKQVVATETYASKTVVHPPTAIGGGPPATAATPLTSEQFDNHVLAHRKALRQACFDFAQAKGVYSVKLEVTVRPDGSVAHVSPATSSTSPITRCIEREVSSWQFPPSEGGTYSMQLYFGS